MSGITEEKRAWVKTFLGVDLGALSGTGDSQSVATQGEQPNGQVRGKTAKSSDKNSENKVKVLDAEVDAALTELKDEAAALRKLGFDTKQMRDHHSELAKRRARANKIEDNDKQCRALERIKTEARDAVEHCQSLSKAAKGVMGKSTDKPSGEQKSAIYKKALEDLYKLQINVPKGMKNTHLDKVFDMFGSVPKSHVAQDKLKSLTYNKETDFGGAYGGADIEMGDFGKAKGEEDYEINGKVIPANSFNVTTLHEIGHSIDEKKKIMKSNMGKAGCGGWKSETIASITTVYVPELRKSTGVPDTISDSVLNSIVTNALLGTVTKPRAVKDEDWDKIQPWVNDNCLTIRSTASPWNNAPVIVANRVYQEAYGGEWWSYDPASRNTTKVNDYQWRSPWEWFAEVYAISWLARKKPPSGVDSSVAAYMWKSR